MFDRLVRESSVKGARYVLARRGFSRCSTRSLANAILNRAEEAAGRERLLSNPDYLQIEPTTSCNLSCTHCGLQSAWKEIRDRAAYMPRDTFLRLAPFLRTARLVILQGWGEPFLHPDLLLMVESCKSHGAMVGVLTNGLLVTDEIARSLVEAGLDLFGVSVDAATDATYRAIRGGDLSKVEDGLARIAREKARRRSRYPIVQLSYTLMKRNLEELPKFVDLGARHGADEILINHLIAYGDDMVGQTVFDVPDEVARVAGLARAKAERLGMLLFHPGTARVTAPDPHCAFRTFAVLADGTVGPCGAQRVLLQHLDSGSLREVWNGEEYRSMRRSYARKELPHTCEHCPNFTNAREDHVSPDMTYLGGTLSMRRWDQATIRSRCGAPDPGRGEPRKFLSIGGPGGERPS